MSKEKTNQEDNLKISKRLKQIKSTAVRFFLAGVIFALLGAAIPLGFLPKAGGRIRGDFSQTLPERIGILWYIILMVVIAIGIVALILHLYHYSELKNDLKQQFKTTFKSKIKDFTALTDDLGNNVYRIWLQPNAYALNKIEVNSDNCFGFPTINTVIEIEITCKAHLPLRVEIIDPQLSDSEHAANIDRAISEATKKLKNHNQHS
ncbi:hypothetical protein [Gelidibacter pelagius]|uniref:DUF304 domain-containing protein n=1 Tax=Gelidibacter pelagius TaxID=2819985 RepID=A0ABS3SUT1_9FLAO|nr:hypothetical protein [Gelidibacter pelagius]MBO3099447.1 hypothetical protein [Gelidibacter pelagius]